MPTTVYMDLDLPTVGVTLGPPWATMLNAVVVGIDAHDHSSGKGVKVTPLGLDISSDLTFTSGTTANNAIGLKAVRFVAQSAPLSGPNDKGQVYVSGVDLYYNDTAGNQVRLTSGGTLNAAALVSSIWTQSAVRASDDTIAPGDTNIDQRVNTGSARIETLPLASAVAAGRYYVFSDVTGNAHTHPMTLSTQGGDAFKNLDGGSSVILPYSGGAIVAESDGVSKWYARVLRGAQSSGNTGETRLRTATTVGQMLALTGMSEGDVCLVMDSSAAAGQGLFYFVKDGAGPQSIPTVYSSGDASGHWWIADGYWWGLANGLCTLDSGGLVRSSNLPHQVQTIDVESVVAASPFNTASSTLVDVTSATITPIAALLANDIFEATATFTAHAITGVTSEVALIITDAGGTTTGTVLNGGRATTTNGVDATYAIQLTRLCVTGGPVTAKLQARQVGGGGSTQINGWALKLRVTRP